MKVLLVNGSPHEKGCTFTALSEIAAQLEKEGVDAEIFNIGVQPTMPCMACRACKKLGKCVIDDKVNEFVAKADGFDGFVFGSPVHYASASGVIVLFRRARSVSLEACGGGRQRQTRGDNGDAGSAEQVFSDFGNARCIGAVLEHGTRQHARRSAAGCRRIAEYAYFGEKYGLSAEMQASCRQSGHYAARSRNARTYEFYPLRKTPSVFLHRGRFFQSRVKISVDAKISLAKAAGNRGKPWDVNIYKKFL